MNVSTDLGTSLWYSGHADDAVAQYRRSLSINPPHAQTLPAGFSPDQVSFSRPRSA